MLDGAEKPYSRDKVYVLTAVFLAVLTALEVAVVEVDFVLWSGPMLVPVLLILMAVKFFAVAWIFMHLKFDKPILTWAFYAGLITAVLVYLGMLTAFRIWWPGAQDVEPGQTGA
nr:cytochrome C oxidase subunit IV family protein [Rhabdothermincola salaria]